MKKLIAISLCIILLLTTACQGSSANVTGKDAPQSESALKENQTLTIKETEPIKHKKIKSPSLEGTYNAPIETLEVYRFFEGGEIYSHSRIDFKDKEQNILSVIETAVSVLPFVKEHLPIKSIEIQKSYVTIDFDNVFIDEYSKGEIMEIQNTVGMTLFQNAICASICFSLGGDKNVLGGENFKVKPLAFAKEDPSRFAAITSAIPYEGIDYTYRTVSAESYKEWFGIELDETATEIAQLLTLVGKIDENAASPNELNMGRFLYHCVQNTKCYWTDKNYEPYLAELIPIADSISAKLGSNENMFWIADHIQKTAKYILGDDIKIDLSKIDNFSKYKYFEEEGVITPPHMGGGYNVYPIVKSYVETENGYKADVVYLFESMGEMGPWGSEKVLTKKEIKDYVKNTADIAEIIVKREDDNRLVFVGCVFK